MAEAPSLVLLHGLGASSFSWRRNLEAFSRVYRTHALDLPILPPAEVATQVSDFLGRLGERCHLLGTSAGGLAALLCARQRPELVGKLVLVAPLNPFLRRGKLAIRLGATAAGELLMRALQLVGDPVVGWALSHRLYAGAERVSVETVKGYAQPLRRREVPRDLRRVYAAWDVPSIVPQHPVLLIWGQQDCIVPLQSGRRLAEAWQADLRIMPGCGHLPYEEQPEAFNQLVLDFLKNSV